MTTVSDEALVIICIENNYDRWTWEAKSDEEQQGEEKPHPRYTDITNKAFKYGGWSEDGNAWFNELVSLYVPALRKSTAKMEVELRDMYVQKEQERLGKRKRKEVADNPLELIAVMEIQLMKNCQTMKKRRE
jgi:hypothetical protein